MDHMDIDQVVEIPDTPDRFTRQGINGRMGAILENNRSLNPFHEQQPLSEEGSRDQPMVIDSGNKGSFLRPPKRANSPINSRRPNTSSDFPSASSFSSRNTLIFRKGVTEKNPRHLSHDSLHKQHLPVMRPPSTRQSSFLQNDGFPDPTEGNFHKPAFGNASIRGMPGNNQSNFLKRSGLANGTSSHGLAVTNLSPASSNASEETINVIKVSSSTTTNEGLDFDDNRKPGSGGLLPRNPIASPRVNKQKRLVRNGCISPNNIAKAKQLPRKDIDSSVAATHDNGFETSSARPISTDIIMELVAEDNDAHSRKGKGVISLPCSSKGPDFQNKNLHTRRCTSFDEKAKSTEESGGWRSTHNQTRDIKMPSHDQEHFLIKDTDNLRCPTQHHETRSQRSGKGIRVASGDDYSKELSNISSERVHTSREPPSSHSARLGRLNAPRAADLLIKRQKQVSNSSSRGECSRPVSDDPEVIFLSSSAEAGNSKSTASNVGNLQKIIEVDETSPQLARNDHDEDVRSRQVEADELLARELQEQFYNEVPVFGEVDDHIALASQQQEGSSHGFPRGRRPVPEARSTANLHRQFQARSSVNAPRRGAPTRVSTLGRMTRLRNRFPGQGRTLLPSRGRTSMFPPDMDVDMRMFILGTLEEFSDMGMNSGLLQADRDFNEDDYEMLLALDENNYEHGGASIDRINGLPQSTVQSDYEEACAICLDTLTIGDTIRHLPCLHKFHKDCIDPWLRRRSSCPVCKSDIA